MRVLPRPAPLLSGRFWRAYAVTLRPYLVFVSGASGLLGLAFASQLHGLPLLLAAAVFFLAYGLGQAVTDVFQLDTDSISAPFRPLVQGEIGRRQVLAVSLTGLGACALVLALLNHWTLPLSALAVVGLATYTPLKRRWWGGPPWNAGIVACLPVLGYLCGGGTLVTALADPELLLAAASVFATYAVFVLLGYFKDVAADRATGYRTLPVRFGRRVSVLVSAGLLGLGVASSAVLLGRAGALAWPGGREAIGLALWLLGLTLLSGAHLRILSTTRDDQAPPAIAMVVSGYVALHLGEASILRPEFALPGGVLFLVSVLVLRWRPYRSQI